MWLILGSLPAQPLLVAYNRLMNKRQQPMSSFPTNTSVRKNQASTSMTVTMLDVRVGKKSTRNEMSSY
jgi:hypothetical protein